MKDINEDDAVDEERCDLVHKSIQVVEDKEEEEIHTLSSSLTLRQLASISTRIT